MTTVPPHDAVLLSLLWSTEGGLGAAQPPEGHEVFILLERMGTRAIPLLGDTLETSSHGPTMRMAAAWLLGRIGGDRAAQVLRGALGSRDRNVAGAARSALERIDRRRFAA
ncbi:MAG: HEAT repeat domain-containing protein [Planctomycetota bacterium]|nr:HEAT repeat domain-containing protein [Planctomycetota bacterium]